MTIIEESLYHTRLFKVVLGIIITVILLFVFYYPLKNAGLDDSDAKLVSTVIAGLFALVTVKIRSIAKRQERELKPEKIGNQKLFLSKTIERLVSQRTRLDYYLSMTESSQEKMEIEKNILDIESQIIKAQQKLFEYEKSRKLFRKQIKKNIRPGKLISAGVRKSAPAAKLVKYIHPERFISRDVMKGVPSKSQKKLRSMLKKVE